MTNFDDDECHSLVEISYLQKVFRWVSGGSWRDEFVVSTIILISYLLVYPIGEYVILDDWAFVKSLQYLQFDGQFRLLHWNPMSLIGHLLWGLLFTGPAGFSMTLTKVSVVVMHLVECLALLWVLRLANVRKNLALAAVAALIFNPLHFVHCFMYLTDVPAIAWQMVSLSCYAWGLTRRSREGLPFCLGSLAAGVAFLIRQNGLLVPLAFGTYLFLWDRGRLHPKNLLYAFAPVILIIGGFQSWYNFIHGPTEAFERSKEQILEFLQQPPITELPYIGLSILMYLGFFLVPCVVAMPLRMYWIRSGKRLALLLGVVWIIGNLFFYNSLVHGHIFPYIWNVVTPFGLFEPGNYILGDMEVLWGMGTAWIISLLSFIALLGFVSRLITGIDRSDEPTEANPVLKLLLLFLGFQLVYLFCTAPILFDRHLISLAPVTIAIFCILRRNVLKFNSLAFLSCLLPMAVYSVTTTHDLHAVSRTAFVAGNDLIAEGIDPKQITAGYAFDCWYTYEERQQNIRTEPSPLWWEHPFWSRFKNLDESKHSKDMDNLIQWRKRMWWPGPVDEPIDIRYAVTTSPPLDGSGRTQRFQLVRRYAFKRWWPWKTDYIYVLRDSSIRDGNDSRTVGHTNQSGSPIRR